MKLALLAFAVVFGVTGQYRPSAMVHPQPHGLLGTLEVPRQGQAWVVWFLSAKPTTGHLVARVRVTAGSAKLQATCESPRVLSPFTTVVGACFVVFPEGARLEGLDIAEYEDSQFQKAEVVP